MAPLPPALTLSRAHPGEAAEIAALHNPFIRHTSVTFTSQLRAPEEIAALIASGQPHWLARQNGRAVGFATWFAFRKGPGYARSAEHTIVLAPAAQGRGVGRALMTRLETDAAGRGIHSLFAGVSGENGAGVAFHARLGFVAVARLAEVGWKFGRWHDLVLMQKTLSGGGRAR